MRRNVGCHMLTRKFVNISGLGTVPSMRSARTSTSRMGGVGAGVEGAAEAMIAGGQGPSLAPAPGEDHGETPGPGPGEAQDRRRGQALGSLTEIRGAGGHPGGQAQEADTPERALTGI